MAVSELDQMLADSAAAVLENMFFTTPTGDADPAENPQGPWMSARLSFHGNPSGRFGIRTPLETGRKIAASFLGVEEDTVTESQAGEVICELANMLCGSVLSRLEEGIRFELSHPELDSDEAACPEGPTASRLVGLEEGPLALWLELEQAE